MPVLRNGDVKIINGLRVDKENDDVIYNDEKHLYLDKNTGSKYTSVTTLVGAYCQPFLEDFWASYKACEALLDPDMWRFLKKDLLQTKVWKDSYLEEYDIDIDIFNAKVAEIKEGYKKNRENSILRGIKIHAKFEDLYSVPGSVEIKKYGLGGSFKTNAGNYKLNCDRGVFPEFLISHKFDDYLMISGQLDCLILDGDEITIVDYKGLPLDTKIPTKDGWSTMKDIKKGDIIFDKDGNLTNVINKSSIHYNPCFRITFDNGDSIIADHEHKWLVSFRGCDSVMKDRVMSTIEIAQWLIKKPRISQNIPKIRNASPLNLPEIDLPIDPYVFGCWLGDGSKSCGIITNVNQKIWNEIQNRGYSIGDDVSSESRAEMRTVYSIRKQLKELGVLNKKFIPDIYMRSSYSQRLDLLRGLMDTDGYYHASRKRFVVGTTQKWQAEDVLKLVSTLGIKATIFEVDKKYNGKIFKGWDVCFSTNGLNPFLVRNQDIEYPSIDKCSFRNIVSVERVDTVATQCIEVDSPTHTFLFGESMIVTHNTNKKIDMKSYFDPVSKKSQKMKFPVSHIDDSSYWHYVLQLSTYAYLLQKKNSKYKIKKLIIHHIDHDGKETEYECPYLKDEVEKILLHYRKENKKKMLLANDKPIVW